MMSVNDTREHGVRFPKKFAEFIDFHDGETIIVCGCGHSLKKLKHPEKVITIGVNDVGRIFTPDYLVVLNTNNQFKGDRFHFVESSQAKVLFTHLNLDLKRSNIVRFKLGKRGGTYCFDVDSLPYTSNTPYVACCLAAYMGAKKIGLIGVDFTDNHFFASTGKHPLRQELHKIDKEYEKLSAALAKQGVELVNLSQESLLTSLGKVSIEEFLRHEKSVYKSYSQGVNACNKSTAMKIQIEKHSEELIGVFFDRLANTANKLGHKVERSISHSGSREPVISVVWNGRRYRNSRNVIFCEHGWLPRDAYQVSPKGINADSHIAPYCWDGKALEPSQKQKVRDYVDHLKMQGKFQQEYTQTAAPAVKDLPTEFLLVPLQLEHDTNIVRHVSPGLRKMQLLVDYVSRSNPPYPVIYKQHPVDVRNGNRHMQLTMRRSVDCVRSHSMGNIHQILKSGACKGIISLNSNVVHDGFLWDVPAVVLGRNIWPREGASPFLTGLPRDWERLHEFYGEESVVACRESYIHYLIENQWSMSDAYNTDKVGELLDKKYIESHEKGALVSLAARKSKNVRNNIVTINVVAKNKGWLFEDLKKYFSEMSIPGVKIVSTEKPSRKASSWIYLRASEASRSPDISRTLIQIHDQFDDGLYEKGRGRRVVKDCGGICFTHPDQKKIFESHGIDLSGKSVLIRPLGALKRFSVRKKLPDKFTIAWVGRPVLYKGEDFKRVNWLLESLDRINLRNELSVVLIGDRLQRVNDKIKALGYESDYFSRAKYSHARYPNYYQNVDCVVITSEFAAGPNCLFESLASGVPVITTPCGWVNELVRNGENGIIINSPVEISEAIENLYRERLAWFSRRQSIRETGVAYSLEKWLEENIRIAAALGSSMHVRALKQAGC